MSSGAETQWSDLAERVTAAAQRGDALEPLLAETDLPTSEVKEVVDIIQSLQASLKPVEARAEFAERLRAELGVAAPSALWRLRQMPARVHVAAILALVFGCALIALRRLFGSEAGQEIQEEVVATPL